VSMLIRCHISVPLTFPERTTRFALLSMSLSALLDVNSAHDFLRGLLGLLQEFDTVTDDNLKPKTVKLPHPSLFPLYIN
jgi:hypothetical protein